MGLMDLRVRVTSAAMLTDNRKELRATLRKAGGEVLAAAKAKIRKGGSGRTYRGSGGGTAGGARQYLRGNSGAAIVERQQWSGNSGAAIVARQ